MEFFRRLKAWIRCCWNTNLLLLADAYEVDCSDDNVLGRGAYGIVWQAKDFRTQQDIAVKKVARNSYTDVFVERELKFLRECEHDNIVKLLWAQMDRNCAYFVMEYYAHGNLNSFMKDRDISVGLCICFMLDIAEAVTYLHTQHISHRDIKPANILVQENDGYLLILADFGLARYFPVSSTNIDATRNTGTVGWMAPEVHTDSDLTCHYNRLADVFSTGLLYLAMLLHTVGHNLKPFAVGGTYLGMWMKALHNLGQPSLLPHIAVPNDRRVPLIRNMLRFEPNERYRMAQVRDEIKKLSTTAERRTARTRQVSPRTPPRQRHQPVTAPSLFWHTALEGILFALAVGLLINATCIYLSIDDVAEACDGGSHLTTYTDTSSAQVSSPRIGQQQENKDNSLLSKGDMETTLNDRINEIKYYNGVVDNKIKERHQQDIKYTQISQQVCGACALMFCGMGVCIYHVTRLMNIFF